jgi:aminoglycoside phosphotransferase (APT) family kinase protein
MTDEEKFEQVIRKFYPQCNFLRTGQLKGGVSAQMTVLEVALPDGQKIKMIVRQHGEVDRQHNPHIAADEFKLLRGLRAAGLPVPTPYHLDLSGEIFSTPYLVAEYVEGMPEFSPAYLADFILQAATTLTRIHRVDYSCGDFAFLPEAAERAAKKLSDRTSAIALAPDDDRIRETLQAVWPLPHVNPSGLLHGDYWPGNLLWEDGQLAAVIDWEDAALGDPLIDLANTRLEILWAFGIEAMQDFTHHYQSIMMATNFAHLPYWDLYAAWGCTSKISEWAAGWPEFGRDDVTEKTMREALIFFISQAFDKLSTS